jgi:acyl carrier protein
MTLHIPEHHISAPAVRGLILAECAGALAALGIAPDDVPDDFDLRASGVIDSLGFLELVGALEDSLDMEIDLELLDPDQLTTVGPLAATVAEQAGRGPAA